MKYSQQSPTTEQKNDKNPGRSSSESNKEKYRNKNTYRKSDSVNSALTVSVKKEESKKNRVTRFAVTGLVWFGNDKSTCNPSSFPLVHVTEIGNTWPVFTGACFTIGSTAAVLRKSIGRNKYKKNPIHIFFSLSIIKVLKEHIIKQ
ncbi:hypothetical protein TNIN_217421 [Trichonephila inaurata madagascariensis]|uniref:Uncharacterized protein n=1 Tax=Trichonephila inaurata madagascariensis TaxID=2747483 RepID=A0A8X6XYP0_9ARAC|nr:hypothetical protein TNIN_217421 [Trichonephila inaurata madagascariensis]